MSNILTFDNYVYPLLNGCLNIANTDYETNLPKSFGLAVFHQDKKTVGLFSHNASLSNSNDPLTYNTDYSGNLSVHLGTSSDASGDVTLNQHGQTLTLYYGGNTYTGIVDTSSNISYRLTSSTHSDASGYYSATIYDVTHGGEFIVYSNGFTYNTAGTNVVLDGSGCVVTFPLLGTNTTTTRTHAVGISSYVTYVDSSGNEDL